MQAGEDPAPIFDQAGWTAAIIKPLTGASSHWVERVQRVDLATSASLGWFSPLRTKHNR